MAKRNPEIRLLIKILAVAGFIILLVLVGGYIYLRIMAPHLLKFSKGIEETRIELDLDSLQNARFIQGMTGCENLWPDTAGNGLYVTTLDGYIHYLDGEGYESLRLVRSLKSGSSVTGICRIDDSTMAAVVNFHTLEEWTEKGAAVCLVPASLDTVMRITGDYPAANGICADSTGNLYFASGNFDFLDPSGNIFYLERNAGLTFHPPVALFDEAGLANGLYYDRNQDRIYFSNTIEGAFSFEPGRQDYRQEYLKTRFMEACDDLCTDIAGNIWMTDPGYSTIKVLNPGTGHLARFIIRGIGQTSSCRTRNEQGKDILYLTELKKLQKPFSQEFDGRGVLGIPVNDLLIYLKR